VVPHPLFPNVVGKKTACLVHVPLLVALHPNSMCVWIVGKVGLFPLFLASKPRVWMVPRLESQEKRHLASGLQHFATLPLVLSQIDLTLLEPENNHLKIPWLNDPTMR